MNLLIFLVLIKGFASKLHVLWCAYSDLFSIQCIKFKCLGLGLGLGNWCLGPTTAKQLPIAQLVKKVFTFYRNDRSFRLTSLEIKPTKFAKLRKVKELKIVLG